MYTTLSALFKGICDSIRAVLGSTSSIKHQNIPATVDSIANEVDAQNDLIEEISSILATKVSAYPTVTYDSSTKTLTITEVS